MEQQHADITFHVYTNKFGELLSHYAWLITTCSLLASFSKPVYYSFKTETEIVEIPHHMKGP